MNNKITLILLKQFVGKFGPLITTMVSGVIGILIGILYSYLNHFLHRFLTLELFFNQAWQDLDPSVREVFSPGAIGTGMAIIIYGLIQEYINRWYAKEVKIDQKEINNIIKIPGKELVIDGVPGPKTRAAKREIHDAAKLTWNRK